MTERYRLRWLRRKGRAACRATGQAGCALAPQPLRGRRKAKVGDGGVHALPADAGGATMRADDTELELLRREVSCAALLEHWHGGWRLDRQESTRRSLKYRRGASQILIINHD